MEGLKEIKECVEYHIDDYSLSCEIELFEDNYGECYIYDDRYDTLKEAQKDGNSTSFYIKRELNSEDIMDVLVDHHEDCWESILVSYRAEVNFWQVFLDWPW